MKYLELRRFLLKKIVLIERGYKRAHKRSLRRKSVWNLVLLFLWFVFSIFTFYTIFQIMWCVHVLYYPSHVGGLKEFWGNGISFRSFLSSFFFLMPLFIVSVFVGMVLANVSMWSIHPARHIFDQEAKGIKNVSMKESMSGLFKIIRIITPFCLLLSFIGAVTLRNLR